MKYLLDTNVYVEAFRSEEKRIQFQTTFYPLLPVTFLSATVAYELSVNAKNHRTQELVTDFVAHFARVSRIITPTFDDWIEASTIMTSIAEKDRSWRSKLPALLNDILIALSARRIGAMLLTYNRDDFLLIRKHKHFFLHILESSIE